MLTTFDERTPLHEACNHNDLNSVQDLIKAGHPLDAQDITGETPLHLACSLDGNIECIQTLLNAGASVNIKNNCLRTPLHIACRYGQAEYVRELINFGCNLNSQDKFGNTSLHFAVFEDSVSCVEMLIQYKADLDLVECRGRTPLCASYDHQKFDCMNILLGISNINAQDNHGRTLLHYAVVEQDLKRLKLFLDHGAIINVKDNKNQTPYDLAKDCEYFDIIDFFDNYFIEDIKEPDC